MNLYYTLFKSYITLYGITVWGSIPNQKLNKLFNGQCTKKYHVSPVWQQGNISR